jgi:hypothetical protein
MTVSELKEMLEEFDGGMEVRFAHQPNYPFELSIDKVWFDDDEDSEYSNTVYLLEGEQIGYFTKRAWE